MMKRGLALLSAAAVLVGCAQQSAPTQAGTPNAGVRTQYVGPLLSMTASIQAQREQLQETTTRYLWELSKTAHPDGDDTTVSFDVTATLKKTSATAITDPSVRTQVFNVAGQPLNICNSGLTGATITSLNVTLVGYDSAAVALAPTVDLSGLFPAVPFNVAAGSCVSATYALDTANAAGSTPPLSAAQATMLHDAAQFGVTYAVNAVNGAAGPVSPALTTTEQSSTVGDASVTLADPAFGFSQVITDSTTKTFTRAFTCADKTGLTAVPGSSTDFTFLNTATLTGQHTNLSAQATDTVTLHCALSGCTYTQGYYKTHAQYFGGKLNKKYDPSAWAGARDWTGPVKLMVGGVAYTQQQIVNIYNMSPAGNQAIALFHQLATAKLNGLKQPTPSVPHPMTAAAIAAADAWFSANPGWLSGTYSGNPSQWISLLDAYNNGADSQHCD